MLRRLQDGTSDDSLGKVYDPQVIRRLIKYLKPYKAQTILALAGMIVLAVTTSAVPWLISLAIDRFITSKNLIGLNIFALIFIGNGLFSWLGQYIQLMSTAVIGQGILLTLRTQMFDHLQRLSLSFYDRHEVGRIMSRVQNDIQALQDLLTSGIISISSDFLSLGLIIFFMLSMNPRLTLVTFTVVPLLLFLMSLWQRSARNTFRRVREAISVVNAGLQENISGVRVIQSLSRENVNQRLFDEVNQANLDANLRAGRLAAAIMPLMEILTATAMALVVIYGGSLTLSGQMMAGALVAFTLYVQRFFEPIRQLTMQYTELQRAMAAGVRIFEVLDVEPEIQDSPDAEELPPVNGEIRFQNVYFSYQEGAEVLHDINLETHPGETLALIGPTGAGKTTLVSLLARFYEVSAGSITIDGHDIRGVSQDSLRRQMGFVLQDPFLFSATVKDNIRYARPQATDQEVVSAAEAVGAHPFIQRLEQGYNTLLQERGSNLSLGQRQLISLARALLADPRILVLDEATANIDSYTEALIQKALRQLLAGRVAFVIAHRLSTIHHADRIVVMDEGRIVEIGSHSQLLAQGGLYAQLYAKNYAGEAATVGDKS
ncbi:MAG: ABC transporter ATP-binding protein [Chloroflexi bacterium]|nr:ABC transporter ATP-binding protein [Chloroflexota bacterium]